MNLKPVLVTLLLLVLLAPCASAEDIVRQFRVYNASDGLADNSAQSINCTPMGRMVITTIGHINFYIGNGFTHVDPEKNAEFRLKNYRGYCHPYFDKYNHFWLKNKYSVTCLDRNTEHFVVNIDSVLKSFGVKDVVTDLFVDDDGQLWLTHDNKIYGTEVKKDFPVDTTQNLQDVANYDGRQLLLFYESGEVEGFDIKTLKHLFRLKPYDLNTSKRYDRTSLLYRYGDSYFQIRNGRSESLLMRFDVMARRWKTLMTSDHKLNNLVVRDSIAYLAAEYGYWTYNLQTGEIVHETNLQLEDGSELQTDVNTIAFDRQGGMWIGTEQRGLLYAKPFSSPFKVYNLSTPKATEYYHVLERQQPPVVAWQGMNVNSVLTDSRGWTWVCTRYGVELYKKKGDKPRVFTRNDGLYNDVIHSAIEDDFGDVWVSTSYGISQIVIRNGEFVIINSYNHADNVPNETFINGRVAKLEDGTIVMQALDNIVAFNPASFHHDSFRDLKFYPKLTELLVNGNAVEAGTEIDGNVISECSINRLWEIDVNYYHNSLSFAFTALNYFRPLQTYYRYRIPELDEEWRVISHFNEPKLVDDKGIFHLQLTGLEPGEYHIELQASMHPDVWIQEPYIWVVRVNEPWWRTTAVYYTLAIILLVLIVLNVITFNRNLRLKMARVSGEDELMRQLRTLVGRCEKINSEPMSLQGDDTSMSGNSEMNKPTSEFVSMMLKIIPLLQGNTGHVTLKQLAKTANVNEEKVIMLTQQNISKNLYEMTRLLLLGKAEELLKQKGATIEKVANACGFSSPNKFVAAFFRHYKMTPKEFMSIED